MSASTNKQVNQATYEKAAFHYASTSRRDAVKRFWEEPLNHSILRNAVQCLPIEAQSSLRVIDVGAGVGDGLSLLNDALGAEVAISYLGIDNSAAMINAARRIHKGREDIKFCQQDIRLGLPDQVYDLYLSCGVPYSHLNEEELEFAIERIFEQIRRNSLVAAVVIDVLGRYSIEWVSNWGHTQWDYNLSFFVEGCPETPLAMKFHSRQSLQRIFTQAARKTGISIESIQYYDRSILVGLHTATLAFNPNIPPYRTLVNQLFEGSLDVDLSSLFFKSPESSNDYPTEIAEFFDQLAYHWNAAVNETIAVEDSTGISSVQRINLAKKLCSLEHKLQQGLGAAHTLIAAAIINGN